ncbi:site-2 protease family protein [Paucisalibacillus sp. EB02]|uniref:site-2 protease family protein n=1 Tax=Paucisalibacillus sp. EB02 TaxID=1347087 RepID=UPI0005A83AC8|nr:site-2 protease family protein [Paucisalibacillus sp. EB02]
MNTVLLIYLVFIVAPISNLIHELGHMLGAMLAKADEITLYVGRGRKLCGLLFRQTEIQFGMAFFTSGLTISTRKEDYRSHEMIYIAFFGPLLNGIMVFIFYFLYINLPNTFIFIFMLYNGWLCLMNCLPFKIGKQESDGYIIVRQMFSKKNVYK